MGVSVPLSLWPRVSVWFVTEILQVLLLFLLKTLYFCWYICIVSFSAIPNYLNQVHGVDMPPNQFRYCGLMIFMVVSSFLCSTYLLIAMTFERFYSIIQPHKAASFNTVMKAKITILCVFVLCFSYSLPFVFIGSNNGRFCIPHRFASNNVLGELYYWLTEIITFIFPFISLLIMNSVIIHTLRKRSIQNILGSAGKDENEGHNVRNKHPEKQIFTMLLLVTFVFLALNTPTHLLVFYLNFYSGTTPYYYAGLHLFYQIGDKMYYTNQFLSLCYVRPEVQDRFKKPVYQTEI